MSIKKILITAAAVILGASALAGCGKNDEQGSVAGLTINKDLTVDAVIIEDFDSSLYDVAELQDMIVKEAAEYCSEHGTGKVIASAPELIENQVRVGMTFASAQDYSDFNLRRLYIDTLENAVADNKVNISFKSVKENEPRDVLAIENLGDYYLIITDEAGYITCPEKVMFISDGIDYISKQQVLVTDDMDGLAYIICLKK